MQGREWGSGGQWTPGVGWGVGRPSWVPPLDPFPLPLQLKINMGVTTPERLGPGYVNHLEVGQAVASLVEKRVVSHTVLSANSPADLKTLALDGKV